MNRDIQTTNASSQVKTNASSQGNAERGGRARYSDAALTPSVDVAEDPKGITLFADLPGVTRDKLNLQVESGKLTIEAESGLAMPEGLASHHTEVSLARYRRVFTLSKELDTEQVSAELAQGVLKLRIPKAQHAQPRRIEVRVA